MSMETYYKNYLSHHGIRGQKWGKKNGPPYPLAPGDHSASEKKAGWKKSLDGYGSAGDNGSGFHLSDKQKKWLKTGAAIAAGALVAYGGYKFATSPAIRRYMLKGIEGLSKSPSIDDMIKNSGPEIIRKENNAKPIVTADNAKTFAKNVNPTGDRENCGSVASAVLDNMNGGNSQALPKVPDHMKKTVVIDGKKVVTSGYDPDKLIECYEGGKWSEKITDFNGSRKKVTAQLEKELLAQGDGAKGIFYCEKIRQKSSGHYFAYAVIDNKVHVIEGQPKTAQSTGIDWSDNLYNDVGQLFDLQDGNKSVRWARLDNCKVKPDRRKDLFMDRT